MVFRNDDGDAQLFVDLPKHLDEVRGRDRVKLRSRFVQQENFRLHDHHGSQIENLPLPVGKVCHRPEKPALYPEKRGHLGDPEPDGPAVAPQAFQPEGQFVPDLVGYDLVVGALRNIADSPALFPQGKGADFRSAKQDASGPLPERRNGGFQLFQKSRFAAPGATENQKEIALPNRKVDIRQAFAVRVRIRKIQSADFDLFHFRTSSMSTATGSRQNAA